MAGRQIRLPGTARPAEAGPAGTWPVEVGLPLAATLDLVEIARLVLAAAVPGFAAGASVFGLDHLLKGNEAAGGQRGAKWWRAGSGRSSPALRGGSRSRPSRPAK